jgi:hypothetical protein
MGSFGGFIGHLICHRGIIPIFSSRFGLLNVSQIVALAFLGCWTLIAPTLVIRFQ